MVNSFPCLLSGMENHSILYAVSSISLHWVQNRKASVHWIILRVQLWHLVKLRAGHTSCPRAEFPCYRAAVVPPRRTRLDRNCIFAVESETLLNSWEVRFPSDSRLVPSEHSQAWGCRTNTWQVASDREIVQWQVYNSDYSLDMVVEQRSRAERLTGSCLGCVCTEGEQLVRKGIVTWWMSLIYVEKWLSAALISCFTKNIHLCLFSYILSAAVLVTH